MSWLFPSALIVYAAKIAMMVAAAALILVARRQMERILKAVSGTATYTGDSDERQAIFMIAASIAAAAGVLLMVIGMPVAVAIGAGVLTVVILPRLLSAKRRAKFQEAFDKSLTEALQTIASSLKAGLTLKDSLVVASQNTPPVFAKEINLALKHYRFGVPLDEVLDSVRGRVGTAAANIAFGAMIIGSQLGGNLPEILKKIVTTIRERDRVEGRLSTLTAQGRSQAILLCSAPIAIGIGMYIYDPGKMAYLTSTPIGQVLLGLAIVLELIGIVVTRKVMQLEI